MSALTPGPWTVVGPVMANVAESRFQVITTEASVADCRFERGDVEAEESARADATAIAAVPEMLKALGWIEHNGIAEDAMVARRALEKARGER